MSVTAPAKRVTTSAVAIDTAAAARARTISDRDRDLLKWLSLGKKGDEIAQIMGMTKAQVWQRAHRVMEKLGTETSAGAVAQAFRFGLIT